MGEPPREKPELEACVLELEGDDVPSTKRPSFDVQALAKHIESAGKRATLPPTPAYDTLRESCRTKVAEVSGDWLDEPTEE